MWCTELKIHLTSSYVESRPVKWSNIWEHCMWCHLTYPLVFPYHSISLLQLLSKLCKWCSYKLQNSTTFSLYSFCEPEMEIYSQVCLYCIARHLQLSVIVITCFSLLSLMSFPPPFIIILPMYILTHAIMVGSFFSITYYCSMPNHPL